MSGSTHVRVTLALVLAVSLAGCGAVNLPFVDDGASGDDERARQISADAVAEMESVSAYEFSMRNVVEFGKNELNITADGVVNHSSERLFMNAELAVRTNTTRSRDFSQVYLVGDQQCLSASSGATDDWEVNSDQSSWNQGLSLEEQSTILNASGTEASLLANQTIRGEKVFVVQLSPDAETLKRVVANQSDADFSSVVVENATITQYVAQDDRRLLRSEMHVEYLVDGRDTTMRTTMNYTNYGDVGTIEIPEAAKDAGCGENASGNVAA